MSILDIINRLAATTSRNEKIAILESCVDNDTLWFALFLTYSPTENFYTKFAPADFAQPGNNELQSALEELQTRVAGRQVTGHAAQILIQGLFDGLNEDDREIFKRVIARDMKCGVNVSLINKVKESLIPETVFMLCETDAKKITYPAYSQIKEDGTRCKLIWDRKKTTALSRNGQSIELHGRFDSFFDNSWIPNTLDGELVCLNPDGSRMPRKISNGIINKAIKGTITAEEASTVYFVCWDAEIWGMEYRYRLEWVESLIRHAPSDSIRLIQTVTVNSYEEALGEYKKARLAGMEGTVVKNISAYWQPKRSYDCVKFKAEIEGDFIVDGWEEGTGKNEGKVGALIVQSKCGSVKCRVGIFKDMPETVRETLVNDMPAVVTVLYNERITSKGSDIQSLFLPRVTALRYDKGPDSSNTLEELVEIEKSVLQ